MSDPIYIKHGDGCNMCGRTPCVCGPVYGGPAHTAHTLTAQQIMAASEAYADSRNRRGCLVWGCDRDAYARVLTLQRDGRGGKHVGVPPPPPDRIIREGEEPRTTSS